MLDGVKRIHCVGVGGIGVGALAELLLLQGYDVSGSDKVNNKMTARLATLGVDILPGHQAQYVEGVDLLVYSSAVSPDNPERQHAASHAIPCVRRGALMAYLFNQKVGIAVAGSHGKTTTTSMLAHTLVAAGFDPSYSIGGIMNHLTSPVRLGDGDIFVAEADESDQSFLYLHPRYVIVTNIDHDHLSNYSDDYSQLLQAFVTFLNRLPDNGLAVLNADDAGIRSIIPRLTCRVVLFSLDAESDFRAVNICSDAMQTTFRCENTREETFALSIPVPGRHNVENSLGSIALAMHLGLSIQQVQSALQRFSGVGRRFFCHGEVSVGSDSALLIEDYGHHPHAIDVTIDAVRDAWPKRRLVMVFEPHRYTRTRDCWHDFISVLSRVDVLLLLDVYAAGESIIENFTGHDFFRAIVKNGQCRVDFFRQKDGLMLALPSIILAGDIILFQGAGDFAYKIPEIKQGLLQGL
jgi:UDP-N-acetylmuramate--alanine ligase